MAFATIASNATVATRLAADVLRPAVFVYLDWPTGEIRASTHHKSVTIDGDTWSGVGDAARIDAAGFRANGARVIWTIGLASLPQTTPGLDIDVEATAIGVRAEVYLGYFEDGWVNPVLDLKFIGHVLSVGDFVHRRDENGNWVTDASIEVSNGRHPRRQLEPSHSPETAEAGDTAWRLLPTVGETVAWPTAD